MIKGLIDLKISWLFCYQKNKLYMPNNYNFAFVTYTQEKIST